MQLIVQRNSEQTKADENQKANDVCVRIVISISTKQTQDHVIAGPSLTAQL